MRKTLIVAALALAAFAAYQQGFFGNLREQFPVSLPKPVEKVVPPPAKLPELTTAAIPLPPELQQALAPEPPPAAEPERPPPVGRVRVPCATCKETGRILLSGKQVMDRALACPVCGATGFRELNLPQGAAVCKVCAGMGRRAELTANDRPKASTCAACVGRGFLTRP